jgi:hypothetical protein
LEDVTINQRGVTELNDPIIDRQTGEQVIVNDLSQGSYSVVVKSGPSFSTKKQETVSQLVNLAASAPVISELALDLIVDNMELNKGDEIKTRLRKRMIGQGLVEPTEEEAKELGLDEPPPEDPMDSAIIQNLQAQTEKLLVGNEKIISEIRNKDADTEKKILEAQQTTMKTLTDFLRTILERKEAGGMITEKDVELLEGQGAIAEETQINTLERTETVRTV